MDSTLVTPQISISLAPPDEPVVEPRSPFSPISSTPIDDNDDTFRPVYLTPPPSLTKFDTVAKPSSPLRPNDNGSDPTHGLERQRFEALLQATRERNLMLGSKKTSDLRKEITLKAHKIKQVERRRALFLSKVLAPPSPSATLTPKTPPESPAIFHYSLPSPGLVSPLAVFESLTEDSKHGCPVEGREPWIEKVDFRAPRTSEKLSSRTAGRTLPSLDQITARIVSNGGGQARNSEGVKPTLPPATAPDRPRLQFGVGRLRGPTSTSNSKPVDIPTSHLIDCQGEKEEIAPLTQSNLSILSSRARKAEDMLSTLRRRTTSYEPRPDCVVTQDNNRGAQWKRRSAPADLLPLHQRSGFEHPVLALPGGF
ncbi:hypothetical protein H0H93_008110 [Arthromyces matolae]|nr:hypothetical protein H0H93_008110 [Arthromyces matolae]